jgi:hypothetical protein
LLVDCVGTLVCEDWQVTVPGGVANPRNNGGDSGQKAYGGAGAPGMDGINTNGLTGSPGTDGSPGKVTFNFAKPSPPVPTVPSSITIKGPHIVIHPLPPRSGNKISLTMLNTISAGAIDLVSSQIASINNPANDDRFLKLMSALEIQRDRENVDLDYDNECYGQVISLDKSTQQAPLIQVNEPHLSTNAALAMNQYAGVPATKLNLAIAPGFAQTSPSDNIVGAVVHSQSPDREPANNGASSRESVQVIASSNDIGSWLHSTGLACLAEDQQIQKQGSYLLFASKPTSLSTNFGTVHIAKGVIAFVSAQENELCVFNINETASGGISIEHGDDKLRLHIGEQALLSKLDGDFGEIHPHGQIAWRNPHKRKIEGLNAYTADFSIAAAMQYLQPLRTLVNSHHPQSRKAIDRILKSAVLISLMGK